MGWACDAVHARCSACAIPCVCREGRRHPHQRRSSVPSPAAGGGRCSSRTGGGGRVGLTPCRQWQRQLRQLQRGQRDLTWRSGDARGGATPTSTCTCANPCWLPLQLIHTGLLAAPAMKGQGRVERAHADGVRTAAAAAPPWLATGEVSKDDAEDSSIANFGHGGRTTSAASRGRRKHSGNTAGSSDLAEHSGIRYEEGPVEGAKWHEQELPTADAVKVLCGGAGLPLRRSHTATTASALQRN